LIDNAAWERQAVETEARISERTDVVDRVFMSGESYLSDDGSVICVLIANQNMLGVLFAETSGSERQFNFTDWLYTQRLEQEVERLQRQIGTFRNSPRVFRSGGDAVITA
jgi:hypothetical protein